MIDRSVRSHRPAPWGRPGLAAGLAALVLAGPAPAFPQEPFRQTVVVTATAAPAEFGSLTRSVTVIDRATIAALPASSIADVLRLAASVDVRARGVRGAQTDFAVRGANFGQMLVLVDGVRLNDAQSGHHNGDIPVPLEAVERIEILHGAGSSLHGADAFGGTVNVITRRAAPAAVSLHGGSFGGAGGTAQATVTRGAVTHAISGGIDRSSGFMYDRDFHTTIARMRTTVADRTSLSFSVLRKEFGANNFYGGNSPSREWTNQTLAAVDHRLGSVSGWSLGVRGSYRTHGDRFVYNQLRPELSDNRHRTHAVIGTLTGSRRLGRGATVTLGAEGGGDRVLSTNLGNRGLARASGFGELRVPVGRVQLDTALRVDRYTEFGTSWSPSIGAGWWAADRVRLRASAGRAFRVPTFTERYYSDPDNLARPEVGPETAWAGEAGADVYLPRDWVVQGGVFLRADSNVIDWLRPSPAVRWQTFNVREATTRGVELGVRKALAGGAFVQASYTGLDLDAAAVDQLSKYVLDYAPRSLTAAALVRLPARLTLVPRLEVRTRRRPLPVPGGGVAVGSFDYALLDLRLARRFGVSELAVEGTNLLDRDYQEVAGVPMPGAAVAVRLVVGTR